MRRLFRYFTKFELLLWLFSLLLISLSYFLFDNGAPLTLAASLVGVTSLILCAKGNPIGQGLMVLFSLLYAIISFQCRYYGEMITYVGMSMPMAILALVSWVRNPFKGKHSEVAVGGLRQGELPRLLLLTAAVTVVLYFVLMLFGTAQLLASTLSVTTSFFAVYLTWHSLNGLEPHKPLGGQFPRLFA